MAPPSPPRHVFVTGAGFTRAFVPDAPLLVDDFDNDNLVESVRGLPLASELLEAERNRHRDGFINIERLMTRVHELMPYDYTDSAADEYTFLLTELKRAFLRRITRAMDGVRVEGDVVSFAKRCADLGATCITFNYDDLLDAALRATGHWNARWGYGFFCRPASDTVSDDKPESQKLSDLKLLKLHGSVNWWPRLGYADPVALDAIVHLDAWSGVAHRLQRRDDVARHLEPSPVIVPPVLSKSGLVAQPALRLVWKRAFDYLSAADAVTFLGYSFPPTDIAAQVLFTESLSDLPPGRVTVVGLEDHDHGIATLKESYRGVFPEIPDDRFFLEGAAAWVQQFAHGEHDSDQHRSTV